MLIRKAQDIIEFMAATPQMLVGSLQQVLLGTHRRIVLTHRLSSRCHGSSWSFKKPFGTGVHRF
jgi:hypothetical protein